MVNWSDPDISEWKEEAKDKQQKLCYVLGDREWDEIEKEDWTTFHRKVGFGLYGPPSEEPTKENKETGYNKKQMKQIEKICNQLVLNLDFKNQSIHFACVFVIAKVSDNEFMVPVFRSKGEKTLKCTFVDNSARIYSSWANYLSENVLPKSLCCYPTNGVYHYDDGETVALGYGESPACNSESQAAHITDMIVSAASVTAFTVTGISTVIFLPVTAAFATTLAVTGIATGLYGAARTIYRGAHVLQDRVNHGQSIGLADSDARLAWLSILQSSFGFVHGEMLSSLTHTAITGKVLSNAGHVAFLVIQTGNLTINGLGIVNQLAALIEKHENKNLTAIDVFQFSSSVLFFTNSVISSTTASTIIQNVRNDLLKSQINYLEKQTGKIGWPDNFKGDSSKVLKQLKRVENVQHFYEIMVDGNVRKSK